MRWTLFVVLTGFASCLAASGQDTPVVGMFLEVNGEVRLERDGSRALPRLADFLFAGDRLSVDSGAATFMFCPTSQTIAIGSGATARVLAGSVVTEGPDPTIRQLDCTLPQVALGSESLEHIGAFRPRSIYDPIPLYTGGRISMNRPVFRWRDVEGVDSYELRLANARGESVWVYRTEVDSAPYPESMRPLANGSYTWELAAENRGEILFQESADFEVDAPATGLEEGLERFGNSVLSVFGLDSGDDEEARAGSALTEAVRLENAGYYAEAAEHYRELFDRQPDDRIRRRLAWLYYEAGLEAAAAEEIAALP